MRRLGRSPGAAAGPPGAHGAPGAAGSSGAVTLTGVSTNGVAATLTYDGAAVAGDFSNVYAIAAGKATMFMVEVVGRRTGTDEVHAGLYRGVITRPAAGNVRFVGSVHADVWADSAAETWVGVFLTADTAGNYLRIRGQGLAGQTVNFTARLFAVDVTV